MATSTTINIRIDANLKKKATIIAEDLGMSLSAILKILLRDFVVSKTKIKKVDEYELTDEAVAMIKEAEAEYASGEYSTFDNAEDFIKHLEASDK